MTEQLRTPLKAASGLGSAKAGTAHFIRQRVTAIALALLAPWFVYSIVAAMRAGYGAAADWLAAPHNAILMLLLVSAAIFHMRLGMQVVIEDYIAKHGTRAALLILNTFVAGVLWVASVFSILKVAFGG
jgi:succinate dehydrogenase / fumarate reductase membrane anchor subunit